MKVKDFPRWRKIIFTDRTILKCDLSLMSAEQRKALEQLEVLETKENTTILCV